MSINVSQITESLSAAPTCKGFTITGEIVVGGGIVPGMDCSLFKPAVAHGVSRA